MEFSLIQSVDFIVLRCSFLGEKGIGIRVVIGILFGKSEPAVIINVTVAIFVKGSPVALETAAAISKSILAISAAMTGDAVSCTLCS